MNLKQSLFHPSSFIPHPSIRGRSSMELEQFITNEQVWRFESSRPLQQARLRSSMDLEHRSSKPEVASSSLAEASIRK